MLTEQLITQLGWALFSLSSFVTVFVVPGKASQMWASFAVQWDEHSLQREELGRRQI